MEPTSSLSDLLPSKSAGSPIVGLLEILDSDGQVIKSWRLTRTRCTIGSSVESLVRIEDSSLAPVHALIVFGKNHTLIRSLDGQVGVNGRKIREWLIDEPTLFECGETRCVVYPADFLQSDHSPRLRVAAGSIADQAARLRSAPAKTDDPMVTGRDSSPSGTSNTPPNRLRASDQSTATPRQLRGYSGAESRTVKGCLTAKLDSIDVKAALEPLHLAVQAATEEILALSRKAQESVAQIVDRQPSLSDYSEVTHAIEKLEVRVSSVSNMCENLLANVSETIEGRLSRLDDFLSNLTETPRLTSPEVFNDSTVDHHFTGSFDHSKPTFEETPPRHPDDSIDNASHIEESADISGLDARNFDTRDRDSALPNWFDASVDGENSDSIAIPMTDPGSDKDTPSDAWTTAELNPIYAEDSNRWLSEVDSTYQVSTQELVDADLSLPEITEPGLTAYDENREQVPSYDSRSQASYEDEGETTAAADEYEYENESEGDGDGESSEDSIEVYMSRLLQRVKGTTKAEESSSVSSSITSEPRETSASSPSLREQFLKSDSSVHAFESSTSRSVEVKHSESVPYAPRQAAPENSANLAALRDLANNTARQAIHHSSRKKNQMILIGKISVAILGFGGAVLLLFLNGFRANVAMVGMIASFVVCLLWGYEAVVQFKRLQSAKAASEIRES